MDEPLKESYEMIEHLLDDGELQSINICVQAIMRHCRLNRHDPLSVVDYDMARNVATYIAVRFDVDVKE